MPVGGLLAWLHPYSSRLTEKGVCKGLWPFSILCRAIELVRRPDELTAWANAPTPGRVPEPDLVPAIGTVRALDRSVDRCTALAWSITTDITSKTAKHHGRSRGSGMLFERQARLW